MVNASLPVKHSSIQVNTGGRRRRQSLLMIAAASNNSAHDCKLHFRKANMKPGQATALTLTVLCNKYQAASIECTATLGSVQTLRVQERSSPRI